MTKSQLLALISVTQAKMAALVEERSAEGKEMDENALATVKSFKEEIRGYQNKVEAIDVLQAEMTKEAAPVEDKKADAEAELRSAWEGYLRGNVTEKELEARANVVGTPAKGGSTVPDFFMKELQEKILEFGKIRSKARTIPTGDHGVLTIPTIDDTTQTGKWTDEMGAITPEDFKTGKVDMAAWKVTTAIEVSTELLDDAFFSVESYIAKALGERLSRTMETAFINGSGTKQPQGILKATTGIIKVDSSASGKVTVKDLIGMIHKIDPSKRAGAEFIVSDDVLAYLLTAEDGNGRPLLQQAAVATAAHDVTYTLAGYGVSVNYELDAIAAGKTVAIFGNFNNYFIRDVRNITVKRDDYTGMGTDSVKFFATARIDGKVVTGGNTAFAIMTAKA